MRKSKPLINDDGEIRELQMEDIKRFRPASEVLSPSLAKKLGVRLSTRTDRSKEAEMRTLDVQSRLEYARAGVAVLRTLQIRKEKMRYKEFGQAIGLISAEEKWQAWHRQQVAGILRLIAAAEKQAGKKTGTAAIEFDLIINDKGVPGAGIRKQSRIAVG